MADWISQNLGKVRIEKLIARGGMAEVYYGTHLSLNRPVAVKVMLGHLEEQQDLKARFEREARVLAGLRHPNIVQIYDFDVANGQPYIVMEYIEGPTLAAYLRAIHLSGGRLPLTQIGRLLVMLAAALDYAHAKGVIHRDIKPANVLLTSKSIQPVPGQPLAEDTEPILTDFGLFLMTDSSARSISGTVAGTPAYMSPEQARGERVGPRSDLYSLAVMLYEMLSGRVPFEAESSMGVLMKHIQEPPPPIPELPVALQNMLYRSLAKRPEERYATGREMLRAFLEASNLTLSDVAPGYSITPQLNSPARNPDRSTVAPVQPVPLPTSRPTPPKNLVAAKKKNKNTSLLIALGIIVIGIVGVCALSGLGATAWVFKDQLFAAAGVPTSAMAMPTEVIPVTGQATPTPDAMATQMSGSMPQSAPAFGRLRFYNSAALLDEVILSVTGLPPAPAGSQYEAWLVGGEVRRSLGVIKLDKAGNAEVTLVDEQGRNLLARYSKLEITVEPNPDPSPNPSGTVAFSSGIPPMALDHIRHLFVAFPDTPNQTGMLMGLVADAKLLNDLSNAMLTAYQNKDSAGVRQNAEALYNVLVGKQGKGYGDLDGDGTVTDPSDGYGMLLNGDQDGYIEGTISHADFANSMADASANIHLHTPHVIISAKNVEGWASDLTGVLTQILADKQGTNLEANIHQAVSLADRILNGRDLNGDEKIDPIPGEGGVKTALEHATYMLDMSVFQGKDMLPPPVPEGTPTVTATPNK